MAKLTIPMSDDKHERPRQLAERRKISTSKLIDVFSTVALAEFDTETRFRARAALGSREGGLAMLDLFDRANCSRLVRSPN